MCANRAELVANVVDGGRGWQSVACALRLRFAPEKGKKNGAADAAALCEAASRPDMKFVPAKTLEQRRRESGGCGHVHAADLCLQRAGHRAIVGYREREHRVRGEGSQAFSPLLPGEGG